MIEREDGKVKVWPRWTDDDFMTINYEILIQKIFNLKSPLGTKKIIIQLPTTS
jgi:hypothetical protein